MASNRGRKAHMMRWMHAGVPAVRAGQSNSGNGE